MLPRTIIQSPDFQSVCTQYMDIRMFDEVMDGVLWAAARNPEYFAVPGTDGLGVLLTNPFADIPSFRVMFTYDTANVRLQWMEPAEEEQSDE